MFVQDPILSRTVLEEEEAKFSEVRGNLESDAEGNYTIDTGTYGTEETHMNFHDPEELKYDSKEVHDPLEPFPLLLMIRDRFMRTHTVESTWTEGEVSEPIHSVTSFQKMRTHVEMYLLFKDVNTELLLSRIDYYLGGDRYDWVSFLEGTPSPGRQYAIREGICVCATHCEQVMGHIQ